MKRSKFSRYAADKSSRMIIGELLKYSKGDWLMGTDKDPVPPDMTFVACMDTLTDGWVKWFDGQPVDSKMGLVADGFCPPQRSELDDLDSENWETAENGDLKDPWQRTSLLVFIAAIKPHDFYTFSTSSVGGQNAVGDLCEAHARTTEEVGAYPIVMLASDSYQHKNRALGRVKIPIFKIVDSVDAALFNGMIAATRGGSGFIPVSPPGERSAIEGPRERPPAPPPPSGYDGPDDGEGLDDRCPY